MEAYGTRLPPRIQTKHRHTREPTRPGALDDNAPSGYSGRMLGSPSHRRAWQFALPVIALLALTLPHLDQGDFRTDTGRYAAVGLQAWRDPACFWTLHLQPTTPYFNKPPLVFWIHGLALHLGGVNLVAARLPSILAAALCVLLTAHLGRRLMGRATGLAAGLILALTYEFFRRTREISLDLWQLLFMLAAVAMVVEGVRRRGPGWVVAAGFPLGLALLCKPLMALLALPLLALWLTMAGRKQQAAALPGTVLLALAVAIPWHAAMAVQHGAAFTARYFGAEVAARTLGRVNAEPCWYYLAEIGRTYWPWMLGLGAAGFVALRRSQSRCHRLGVLWAALWAAGWFIALSLFPDKRPRYELPMYPALALLAAHGLVRLRIPALRMAYRRALQPLAGLLVAVSLTLALLPVRVQAPPDANWTALLHDLRLPAGVRVFSAALSTNDEGCYYLATERWPESVRRADGTLRDDIPEGSVLIYTDGLQPQPGGHETLVARHGPYTATRLGPGGWR